MGNFTPVLVIAIYLTSALLSFGGAYLVWRRRANSSAAALAFLSLSAGMWTLLYVLEIATPTEPLKTLWASLKFIFVCLTPLALAAFVLRFAGWHTWPGRRGLALLLLFPTVTVLAVLTNPTHHLFWADAWLVTYGSLMLRRVVWGPWFWAHALYSYVLMIGSCLFALTNLARLGRVYRRQFLSILVAIALPVASNLLTLGVVLPKLALDLSPLTFGISALVLLAGSSAGSLFQVLPLAYSSLLEQIRHGVLILDSDNLVLDLNPAAERMLELERSQVVGVNLERLEHPALQSLRHSRDDATSRREIRLENGDAPHWYEVNISHLANSAGHWPGQLPGRLVIWYDITDRKRIEAELRHASTHDALTGLYNRLYFEEEFQRIQFGRNWPTAIIVGDLDNLKRTNDAFGHAAGDQVVRATAELLSQALRRGDLVARVGGDEFVALIPNCDAWRAESLVSRIARSIDDYNETSGIPRVELSLGCAVADSGEQLQAAFNQADATMYANKKLRKGGC